MQSTFFFTVVFPPPPACPEIFAGPDRAGTGSASDADKSFIVQGIVRHVMAVDIAAYGGSIPMEQGIVLDHLVAAIPFEDGMVLAFGRVFCPQPCDPDDMALQGPF